MFDLITMLLAAAGAGSLAGAFVEYRFSIKKRTKAKKRLMSAYFTQQPDCKVPLSVSPLHPFAEAPYLLCERHRIQAGIFQAHQSPRSLSRGHLCCLSSR